ncbi:MAG: hypothetical protein AAF989_04110 [Planctomycetota bacterium]
MKWNCLLAVAFGLSITDVTSFAQETPAAQRLSPTPSSLSDEMSFDSAGMARFLLSGGRLRLHPSIHRKGRQTSDRNGVHESISVQSNGGIPSLQYSLHSNRAQISLSVSDAQSVRLELVDSHAQTRNVLEQVDGQPAVWVSSSKDERSGDTLFHLREIAPDEFDAVFGDAIRHLLRGQSIAELALQTDQELMTILRRQKNDLPAMGEIETLVDQLASDDRRVRLESFRRLRAIGTPILAVVDRIPLDRLDAEQQRHLTKLRRLLKNAEADSPATLAQRLVLDRDYIVAFAAKIAVEDRVAINRHLNRQGFEPLGQSLTGDVRIVTVREPKSYTR